MLNNITCTRKQAFIEYVTCIVTCIIAHSSFVSEPLLILHLSHTHNLDAMLVLHLPMGLWWQLYYGSDSTPHLKADWSVVFKESNH